MNKQTLEHMKQLRLYGMYRAFDSSLSPQSTNYTSDELVAYLIQSEWDDRQDRKIERLTKAARFRYSAVMEAIDFDPSRCLDKNQIQRFASCDFIKHKQNILVTGSTGAGKVIWHRPLVTKRVHWGIKSCIITLINFLPCLKPQKQMGLT